MSSEVNKVSPFILFLCGLGLFIMAFIFKDTGFTIFAFLFFISACFAMMICDSGGGE